MNSRALKGNRRGVYTPRLEVLEDRTTPACTAVFGPGTLTITGDNNANIITINDAGTGAVGSITVNCDGVVTANAAVVTGLSIFADTLGGADQVFYNLTADLVAGQARTVSATLGDGNDLFIAAPQNNGDVSLGSSLVFGIRGNAGNDRLYFNFQQDFDIDGAMSVTANGGPDNDKIFLLVLGELDGTFSFALNGNAGVDKMAANISEDNDSAGALTGTVNGQADNDLLSFIVATSQGFTGTNAGSMAGGGGINAGFASPFVVVSGVQQLFKLPF